MSSLCGRILLLGAFVLAGASACGAPEPVAREKRGSSQSTLGKPKASIRTAASEATTDKYGITEWRLFRGKKDLFMTGYDADGEAVKGISLAFGKSADDGEAELTTRIHDGSKFTAARNLTTQNLSADALPAGSADFLKQVLGDLGGLDALFNGGGLDGLQLPAGAEGCGADLTAILNQGLACTNDAGQAKAAQAACVAAAKKAAESATACENIGAVDATDAEGGDAAGGLAGIDLAQLGLPDIGALGGGANGAGIDLSKILPADLQNPFAGAGNGDAAGGLDLQNPFGGGLADLFGNAQNGDVGFDQLGGLFGF